MDETRLRLYHFLLSIKCVLVHLRMFHWLGGCFVLHYRGLALLGLVCGGVGGGGNGSVLDGCSKSTIYL